jgi:hypothetical protein
LTGCAWRVEVAIPVPSAAWRGEVVKLHAEYDQEFADTAEIAVDDYLASVERRLATLVAAQELRIRLKPSDLGRWLEDGERLTFHTTGITNGLPDSDARRTLEYEMMGVPLDAEDEDRPRYGYLRGSAEQGEVLNGYGNVLVRLDDSLRDRATIVLGDSMGSTTTVPGIYGGWRCMAPEPLQSGAGLDCRFPLQNLANSPQLHEACDEQYEYAEVQIYDRLLPRDIRQVVFCNGEPAPGDVRNLLAQWGINFDEIKGVVA